MANRMYRIHVRVDGKLLDCGKCDKDHISMISLLKMLHDNEVLSSKSQMITDEHDLFVEVPWNSDRLSISSDAQMLGVFDLFEKRQVKNMIFVVEQKLENADEENPVPIGVEGQFEEITFSEPEVVESVSEDEFDFRQNEYYEQFKQYFEPPEGGEAVGGDVGGQIVGGEAVGGDGRGQREGGEAVGGDEGGQTLGREAVGGDVSRHGEGGEAVGGDVGGQDVGGEAVRGDVGGQGVGGEAVGGAVGGQGVRGESVCAGYLDDNQHLFEGYQSNDDHILPGGNECDSMEATMSKCMDGLPFEHGSGGQISFHVNQTHDSVYTLREVLKDYAIQEGIALSRQKNEKDRLTYKCKGVGCPWRIHACVMKDKVTMKIKRYNDVHQCHRSYKSEEAKVKWISTKFENLVKTNPDV